MPEKHLVINTGPIIALIAATKSLDILDKLYDKVVVTNEVKSEVCFQGQKSFGSKEFLEAGFITHIEKPLVLSPMLKNSLDKDEASVIQYALDNGIVNVCIDEAMGRRIARLNELKVTGSLGILIKGKQKGLNISIKESVVKMHNNGIFLSQNLINKALEISGEK